MALFATSHGKGPCDGMEGTVKRLAAHDSLQRSYDKQILTPRQLYDFSCSEISIVNFLYITVAEHEYEATLLNERFESSRTIAGTHRLHPFRLISSNELEVRAYFSSNEKRIECVSSVKKDCGKIMKLSAIQGYVTARYDGS